MGKKKKEPEHQAAHIAAKPGIGERLYKNETLSKESQEKYTRNSREDRMLEMIDNKRAFEKLIKIFEKVDANTIDVPGMFQAISGEVALEEFQMAFNPSVSEKVRADLLKDILDRAGHSKVNKHAVASVDPNQPKESLISLIMGEGSKLKNDIEIIDDEEDQD